VLIRGLAAGRAFVHTGAVRLVRIAGQRRFGPSIRALTLQNALRKPLSPARRLTPSHAPGWSRPNMPMNEPRSAATEALRLAVAAAASALLLLAGCGDKKTAEAAAQAAAKVNKQEITVQQINFMLQQQRGLKPEQAEAASKQILERLIDQELALQKATELKLDREPRVLQQLEAARREVLSRAYLEKAGEAASKPTAEEVTKYYESNPALFKDRRVYSLQEIAIEAKPEQVADLKAKLQASKNIAEFVEYLKANDFRFSGNQAVRTAEQLPLASLGTFAAMKDGQALLNASPAGAQVIVLAGSRSQPVTLAQATPAIEQFLLNERKREILGKDMKAMRDAAKIEYVGNFAQGAASAAAAAPASSGGLDAPSISKDTGLK
jgi:EpsD family peptidyl-prolyl cis-trans isomerase